MGSYSFKSSGKTIDTVVNQSIATAPSPQPIGIKTPLRLGASSEGILGMNFDQGDVIQDNFRNMLLTNAGERLALIDFGGNLRKLVSEYSNLPNFDDIVMSNIKKTTTKYMPFISLDNFSAALDPSTPFSDDKILRIQISYSVQALNVSSKSIELVFSLM